MYQIKVKSTKWEEECQMVMNFTKYPMPMGQPERNLPDLFKPVFLVTLTLIPKYANYLKTNE